MIPKSFGSGISKSDSLVLSDSDFSLSTSPCNAVGSAIGDFSGVLMALETMERTIFLVSNEHIYRFMFITVLSRLENLLLVAFTNDDSDDAHSRFIASASLPEDP
jgi:hypothetical protein